MYSNYCVFELSDLIMYSNYIIKSCTQIAYADSVFKSCVQIMYSLCFVKRFTANLSIPLALKAYERHCDLLHIYEVAYGGAPPHKLPHNPPLMFFSVVEIEAIAGRVQGRNHNMLQLTAIFRFEFWHLFQSSV